MLQEFAKNYHGVIGAFLQANNLDYTITIQIQDIFMGIFWILLSIMIIYILFILSKVYATVRDIRKLIKRREKEIDDILKIAPQITEDIAGITSNIKKSSDMFIPSVENIAKASEDVTNRIKERNSIIKLVDIVFDTINKIQSFLNKGFKNNKRSKNDLDKSKEESKNSYKEDKQDNSKNDLDNSKENDK